MHQLSGSCFRAFLSFLSSHVSRKQQERCFKVHIKKKSISAPSLFYPCSPLLPQQNHPPVIRLVMVHVFQRTHLIWPRYSVHVCMCVTEREMYKCESLDLKLHKPSTNSLIGTRMSVYVGDGACVRAVIRAFIQMTFSVSPLVISIIIVRPRFTLLISLCPRCFQ